MMLMDCDMEHVRIIDICIRYIIQKKYNSGPVIIPYKVMDIRLITIYGTTNIKTRIQGQGVNDQWIYKLDYLGRRPVNILYPKYNLYLNVI